jgi:hypothetical protein
LVSGSNACNKISNNSSEGSWMVITAFLFIFAASRLDERLLFVGQFRFFRVFVGM